jgi:hypothetical protein
MFDIPVSNLNVKHSRYTWEFPAFREFMYSTLCELEPIRYEPDVIIQDELEDIETVVFIMDSVFHIGFCINNKQFFKIKMKN